MNQPKHKKGELVVFNDLIGKVTDVMNCGDRCCYRIGKLPTYIEENKLKKADHRDVTRITRL